jgi:hypothetical protein
LADGPLWCSYEPAIGPLVEPGRRGLLEKGLWRAVAADGLRWLVWGGESGAQARPFDLQWGRDVNDYVGGAGIRIWSKQLGRRPVDAGSFRWMHHSVEGGEQRLYADGGSGPHAATVWSNGTWHTWHRDGVGGEYDRESSIEAAKAQALAAVLRAGHFPLRLDSTKGDKPERWPPGLLIQEFPEVAMGNAVVEPLDEDAGEAP